MWIHHRLKFKAIGRRSMNMRPGPIYVGPPSHILARYGPDVPSSNGCSGAWNQHPPSAHWLTPCIGRNCSYLRGFVGTSRCFFTLPARGTPPTGLCNIQCVPFGSLTSPGAPNACPATTKGALSLLIYPPPPVFCSPTLADNSASANLASSPLYH